MKKVVIGILKGSETICYAAEELSRYLQRVDVTVCCEITTGRGDITLGILSQLSLKDDDVDDCVIDDVVDVNIQALRGHVAGSNDRSVLMGVYEYLKSAGCMWVRPGDGGEYIPSCDLELHCFTYRKKADLTFRGQCIEGAVSFENVRDMILWMPKVNMNLFMLEMVVPYNYLSRWYKHELNELKEDEQLPYEVYCEYTLAIEKLVKKCGLQLHSLGHGYLFEPYGVRYKSAKEHYEISEEGAKTIALVNGKREFIRGSPNYTQVCMSSDKARLGLVNYLVNYLLEKPYIDFLHVWMSDSKNNHCECDNCRKKIPTDFYVQMLNELDAELTRRGIDTRIVFIMYVDSFWAPKVTKLNNPGRFVMTTAAFRDYGKAYSFSRNNKPLPTYERNKLSFSSNFSTTLGFLDRWKNAFDGKRFLFEYHMYTDHYFDPGYMDISRNMLRDIKALRKEDFDGMMNDQTQRCFFPTGLPMAVMGEAMFDRTMDFDAFADKYFRAAFGVDGTDALKYLENISRTFESNQIRTKETVIFQDTGTEDETVRNGIRNNPDAAERFAKITGIVDEFKKTISRNLSADDECHRESWRLLEHHGDYCKRLSAIYREFALGNTEEAKKLLGDMVNYLSAIEDEIQPQFDLYLFQRRVRGILEQE